MLSCCLSDGVAATALCGLLRGDVHPAAVSEKTGEVAICILVLLPERDALGNGPSTLGDAILGADNGIGLSEDMLVDNDDIILWLDVNIMICAKSFFTLSSVSDSLPPESSR